jgi:hypothetical protein
MTTATETQGTAQQSNSHSPKMIRGYLIRPSDRTVHTVELPDTDNQLDSFYTLMECGTVDVVRLSDAHDCWVDDEGLMKPDNQRHYFAIWQEHGTGDQADGHAAQLCGNALVLSHDGDGSSTSATLDSAALLKMVAFFDPRFASLDITRPDKIAGHIRIGLDGSLTAVSCS